MDVIVTFEDEEEQLRSPRLTLLQLRGLFEDHPTPELVLAMCDQALSVLHKNRRPIQDAAALVRAMYSFDDPIPSGMPPLDWVEEQFTFLHKTYLEIGFNRWARGE